MLDINLIRQESEKVKKGLKAKNADPALVDKFLEVDFKWRAKNKEYDDLRAEQKKLSKELKIETAKALKDNLKKIEADLADLDSLTSATCTCPMDTSLMQPCSC